jgi:hypothetical protein
MTAPPSCRFDSTRGDQQIVRDFVPRNKSWQAVGHVRAGSSPKRSTQRGRQPQLLAQILLVVIAPFVASQDAFMDEFVDVNRALNTRPDEADTSGQDHDRAVAILLSGAISQITQITQITQNDSQNDRTATDDGVMALCALTGWPGVQATSRTSSARER